MHTHIRHSAFNNVSEKPAIIVFGFTFRRIESTMLPPRQHRELGIATPTILSFRWAGGSLYAMSWLLSFVQETDSAVLRFRVHSRYNATTAPKRALNP